MMKILGAIALIVALQIVYSSGDEIGATNLPDIDPTQIYESAQSMAARPYQEKDCSKNVEEWVYFCRAKIPRYRWSVSDKTCVKDYYGGCHQTKNNFVTQEECMTVAEPVCKNL
ncbi:unnamed protein product [Phaedon cochleariae]|uniref:BPTI/Kunitz inhibitor domain-containing protein n=1 Tax=Phaedon cochleariae TaxID=80249 RepID=A0A9P0GV00_PHACE|nr:unnamed protein product [Phaedon cochleariae]